MKIGQINNYTDFYLEDTNIHPKSLSMVNEAQTELRVIFEGIDERAEYLAIRYSKCEKVMVMEMTVEMPWIWFTKTCLVERMLWCVLSGYPEPMLLVMLYLPC